MYLFTCENSFELFNWIKILYIFILVYHAILKLGLEKGGEVLV